MHMMKKQVGLQYEEPPKKNYICSTIQFNGNPLLAGPVTPKIIHGV